MAIKDRLNWTLVLLLDDCTGRIGRNIVTSLRVSAAERWVAEILVATHRPLSQLVELRSIYTLNLIDQTAETANKTTSIGVDPQSRQIHPNLDVGRLASIRFSVQPRIFLPHRSVVTDLTFTQDRPTGNSGKYHSHVSQEDLSSPAPTRSDMMSFGIRPDFLDLTHPGTKSDIRLPSRITNYCWYNRLQDLVFVTIREESLDTVKHDAQDGEVSLCVSDMNPRSQRPKILAEGLHAIQTRLKCLGIDAVWEGHMFETMTDKSGRPIWATYYHIWTGPRILQLLPQG
ncbi:hypothetical protein QBC38DRAFT_443472 [Podospora fimiseda]|uniref:Uncharacterized protein n=1 Tax=Podospora fimiseda TaxID=252190 RepID=A0AAN7GV59_9PEZI|nr:hypothetical protein QBC38DRAFT_443472 [Podospora fimiseda]